MVLQSGGSTVPVMLVFQRIKSKYKGEPLHRMKKDKLRTMVKHPDRGNDWTRKDLPETLEKQFVQGVRLPTGWEAVSVADKVGFHRLIHKATEPLKLALTPANEKAIRDFLMVWWARRWASKRKAILEELSHNTTKARRVELEATRQFKAEYPTDLSGACKVASQFCDAFFSLAGTIFTNKRHAFVLMLDSKVYDINRNCADVAAMNSKGRYPYEINYDLHNSEVAQAGMRSWHPTLRRLMNEFQAVIVQKGLTLHEGPPVAVLPKGAHTKF